MAFSSLRATSVSNCAGAAPGRLADTETVGNSKSGNCCTFMELKASIPAKLSITKSITAGIGFLMDQADQHSGWGLLTVYAVAPFLLGGGCENFARCHVAGAQPT